MTLPSYLMVGETRYNRAGAPSVQPNADGWFRGWVLPDWMSPLWGRMNRQVINPNHPGWGGIQNPPVLNGAPAVNRIGEAEDTSRHLKTPFVEEYQLFWADLMAVHLFGILYDELWDEPKKYVAGRVNALMGPGLAFFNRSRDAKVAYYLTDENLDRTPPMFAPLICAGMTIWIMPQGGVGKVATFLTSMNLPTVRKETLLDPRVGWATNIRNDKTISPFPQLDGKSVPYPLITREAYYFSMEGVELYSHDEPLRSLYVPPRSSIP